MNASENGRIRVCLVDDNPFERSGIEQWIRQDNGIEILGSFDDLESALPEMLQLKPDTMRWRRVESVALRQTGCLRTIASLLRLENMGQRKNLPQRRGDAERRGIPFDRFSQRPCVSAG